MSNQLQRKPTPEISEHRQAEQYTQASVDKIVTSGARKLDKRIVSKGRYAGVLATRAGLRVTGNLLWFAAMVFVAYSLLALLVIVLEFVFTPPLPTLAFCVGCVVSSLLLAGASYLFYRGGAAAFRRMDAMSNVVPHTYANTADLPAPDTLVRASQEPAQLQEAQLLRAADQTQEQHEEQLLRATMGEQE